VTRNSLRFPVAVVSATLLFGAFGPMRAGGTTLDDKKAQAEQLQNQIDENGNKIAALGEKYNGAVYDYQKAEAGVSEAKQHLAAAEAAQGKLSAQVAERGAVLYQGAQDPSSIIPDTNITSINELGARTKYGAVATGNDEQLIANLERAQQDLDVQRKAYEQQANAAAKQRDAIAAARAEVEQASSQEQELLSQVKGEIATLIAQEKEREAAAIVLLPYLKFSLLLEDAHQDRSVLLHMLGFEVGQYLLRQWLHVAAAGDLCAAAPRKYHHRSRRGGRYDCTQKPRAKINMAAHAKPQSRP